ncbi:hypothetical protein [Actinoplanes sp. NPDC020271]|uniref:hypothetical protein n=1 Tax=Actinoplanes sp. NPDC020271 TaxID=3363896 RepID=UPI0037B5BDC9
MNVIKPAVVAAAGVMLLAGCGDQTTTSAPAAPGASAAASTSTGNGIADLSAAEILARAEKAVTDAKSFHAAGTAKQDGASMAIDLKESGKNLLATISMSGMKLEILAFDGQSYVKADPKFLESAGVKLPKVSADILAKSWMKPSADDTTFSDMTDGFGLKELLNPSGELTKGDVTQLDGKPAVVLNDSKGAGKIYVATTGEPLPLKATDSDGADITFSEFGAEFPEIKAPAATEIIKLPGKS